MKKYIIVVVLVIIGTLALASFGPKLRGTSQKVEVKEVKIDTCVYHIFYNYYPEPGGIPVIKSEMFTIRVK